MLSGSHGLELIKIINKLAGEIGPERVEEMLTEDEFRCVGSAALKCGWLAYSLSDPDVPETTEKTNRG